MLILFVSTLSISAVDLNQSSNISNNDMQNITNEGNLLTDVNTSTNTDFNISNEINSTDYLELNPGEYNISNITINKSITIKGNGSADAIIINGQNSGNAIFTINGTGIVIKLENLTFINGYNNQTKGAGAIDNYYATVVINNCIFKNNEGYNGGAISSQYGNLTIINSTFASNHGNHDGGAIKGDFNTLYVENSIFKENFAGRDGGCIGSTSLSTAYINNCTFENNTAEEWAGALYNWASTMYVNNSIINNNTAQWYKGGAITTSGPTYINNSIITNNHVPEVGGAICIAYEEGVIPSLNMENSCIYNNSAGKGNDIYVDIDSYYRNKLSEFNINNNWWGVNNPLNSTDYLFNWSSRVREINKSAIKIIDSWINMETTIDNDTNTITVQAKYTNNLTSTDAENFIIKEEVVFLNDTVDYLNNGIATYTFTQPLNMSNEITRVDYQLYPEPIKNITLNETNTTNETTNITNGTNTTNSTGNITNGTNNTNKPTVVKTKLIVLAGKYYFYNGNAPKANCFRVQLKDANGKILANKNIAFKINKKTYYKKTNSQGIASLPIYVVPGTYTVSTLYNGDNATSRSSISKRITVQKNSITISGNSKVKVRGYYTVSIKSNGKAVVGRKIRISIHGKNFYRLTDKNGKVRIRISLAPKTYTIKTTLLKSKCFNSRTLTQRLRVIR